MPLGIVLISIPIVALAILGYRWIHYWQRVATVVFGWLPNYHHPGSDVDEGTAERGLEYGCAELAAIPGRSFDRCHLPDQLGAVRI